MNRSINNNLVIWVTLFVGLLLQIMPWPDSMSMLKPNWLLMILVYWGLALPHRVGIMTAFFVGIILDLFSGTVLGVNAFIFSVVMYLATFRFQLVRNLALWQQCFVIVGLSICYDLGLFLFEIVIYHMITISPMMFLSSLIDGLLWGWVFLLLRLIRRRFAVS